MRPFWSGTISFGLVSIPVALFPATRSSSRGGLKMVSSEGSQLRRHYVCSEEGVELDNDEIVRGYETDKGKFIVVTDEELEAIEPRKSRDIDLRLFVDQEEIDPVYFERPYYLTPTGGSNKAYRLLAEVMESTGKAGIATFVMRTKEYLVAILAEKGILRAETMRFHDEVRKPEEIGLPKTAKVAPADVKKLEKEIEKRSGKVDFSEFLDDYGERLRKVAEAKAKSAKNVIKAKPEPEEEGAEVIDLLEVLSRSLGSKSGATRRPAKKSPRKVAAKSARKPAKRK